MGRWAEEKHRPMTADESRPMKRSWPEEVEGWRGESGRHDEKKEWEEEKKEVEGSGADGVGAQGSGFFFFFSQL